MEYIGKHSSAGLSRALNGSDRTTFFRQRGQKGAPQMENAFLHFSASLDVTVVIYKMLGTVMKMYQHRKFHILHSITLCPS